MVELNENKNKENRTKQQNNNKTNRCTLMIIYLTHLNSSYLCCFFFYTSLYGQVNYERLSTWTKEMKITDETHEEYKIIDNTHSRKKNFKKQNKQKKNKSTRNKLLFLPFLIL